MVTQYFFQSASLVTIGMGMHVRSVELVPGLTLLQEQRSLSVQNVLVVRSPVEKHQLQVMSVVSLGSLSALIGHSVHRLYRLNKVN